MSFALVTSSGISNTGKLTTQAGILLMQRKPGLFLCMNCKQSAETLREDAGGAGRIIVLDGCTDCCATKKLTAAGLTADVHIIATELGIEKNGMAEVKYDEIEKVLREVENIIEQKNPGKNMTNNHDTRSCSCSCEGASSSPCSCATMTGEGSSIRETTSTLTFANRLDHFLARWSWRREAHRVEPGLYRLGNPTAGSPVFASANYTLSFDALRSALAGIDAWILVLDTKGINVWCAAGKGTFGTDELVRRIESTGLACIVSHRKIIVPQLGAPGISWPVVMRKTKFLVEYGPVRARDLPEYLRTHMATPAMRRVEFPLRDRLVLIPVEFMHALLPTAVAAAALWFLAGPVAALAISAAVLAGTVLFPALLPCIPTHDFSSKGLILGGIIAIPFAYGFGTAAGVPAWANVAGALSAVLVMPAVTAYLALNFTGSTTFTSRTGVKKEIFRYVPVMVAMAALGSLAGIALGVSRLLGVI